MEHSVQETLQTVHDFLAGRIVTGDRLPFSDELLRRAEASGVILKKQGVIKKDGKWHCQRCHCSDSSAYVTFNCAKCEQRCAYCRHCIQMGRVASCDELLLWGGDDLYEAKLHSFHWQGQLTDAQSRVAKQLVESVKQKKARLIHAVCGAGKTEILFESMAVALNEGWRVCVATPRTDVVLELFPRFQRVFPDTDIHALYGGADVKSSFSPLIVTTTHQLYRFEESFDIVFVDEADAFPYSYDRSLQLAVQKAVKKDGAIMYVTATPTIAQRIKATRDDAYSFIPRRFHGFDLPVPTMRFLPFYKKQLVASRIPKVLERQLTSWLKEGKPFLLFFPTIELMERTAPLFERIDASITFVYANEPNRKEKVQALRDGKIAGLLTTTILERGITIPNLQVAVLGAEAAIFTSNALIQISGRVGRSVENPDGDVLFYHHGITKNMDEAIAEIKRLNGL